MTNYLIDAMAAFFSTTIDDLLALMYLFVNHANEEHKQTAYIKLIVGQFVGFTVIVLISLLGILLGAIVPVGYIDLIGFIPLCIGGYKLVTGLYEDCSINEEAINESTPILSVPDIYDDKASDRSDPSDTAESEVSTPAAKPRPSMVRQASISAKSSEDTYMSLRQYLTYLLDPLVLESTMFALLCGSDNIVIYMTLFAAEDVANVIYIIIIFYLLLVVNVCLALVIIRLPPVIYVFEHYAKYLAALLLIGLGIDILSSSVIWP